MSDPSLDTLLVTHEPTLRRLVRREARGLLRFESEDDLIQGIVSRALGAAATFEWEGEAPFVAWLLTIGRRHVADRHDWWRALKRGSTRVLRLTWSGTQPGDPLANLLPPETVTGPGTFAARRESLATLARALDALTERDRNLALWHAEDIPLEEQAERLDVSYAAAQRAGLRALERLRKAFVLLGG